MSSQLQADDLVIVNRGGTNFKATASRLTDSAQVLNTDFLMVQRDATLYKVAVGDLRSGSKKLSETDYLIVQRGTELYNWQPTDVAGLVPHLNLTYKKGYLGENNTSVTLTYENARAYQSTPAQLRDPNGKITFLTGNGTLANTFVGIPDTGMFQLYGEFDFISFNGSFGLEKVEEPIAGSWDAMMPSPNLEFSANPMGKALFKDCLFLTTVPDSGAQTWVYSCEQMFYEASDFNQAVNWSNWITRNVKTFSGMFEGCLAYNQPIEDLDVSGADDLSLMFKTCLAFNKPLNAWGPTLANVTTMQEMFRECLDFNQPLNQWNTRLVTNMNAMFQKQISFNQDISNWCVELIPTKPTDFDTQTSGSWTTAEKPNWGATC